MSDDKEMHVVLGASGGAGEALVRALAARGKRVRAASRSGRGDFPAGVERVKMEATDPASVREAARGAAVVYHCVNVPYPEWGEKLPGIMEAVVAAGEAEGARVVYADNLYMYGPTAGPMTEDTPVRPTTKKGAIRARLAEQLLGAHERGRVRAAIGRGSDFYGPGPLNAVAGERLFGAVRAGKKAMWVGRLDEPHSVTFIDDFARVLATLGERPEALGSVWHTPDAGALTGRELIEAAFREAGKPPKAGTYSRTAIRLVGLFSPQMRELVEMMYQFEQPFVLDGSRFTRTFGDAATPHAEGIRRTLEWYRAKEG
ncbi:MAG TPA: SDR family oxidoreductase [Longimicrobium sp.]|jgi:nucleoside-diphosphate-sugar epimerase